MELIFQQTANRNQCAAQVAVNDLMTQCTFSSSNTVTIPAGLVYAGGELRAAENFPSATVPICRNHEARLKFLFAKFA